MYVCDDDVHDVKSLPPLSRPLCRRYNIIYSHAFRHSQQPTLFIPTGVWCDISTFGVCVSKDIAEKMKGQIPGLDCDDDSNDDDDKAPPPSTDDATPPGPTDDDTKPSDDTVNPDYWNCLEKNSDAKSCTAAGCTWCDTKGGFGICMDKDAASRAADSDWYTCTKANFLEEEEVVVDDDEDMAAAATVSVSDPYDPACLVVTLGGDESQCKQTQDSDGNPCEWCSISSYDVCLNGEQAAIAEQAGGSCGDDTKTKRITNVKDPYDPSCLPVTMGGDESTCKQTLDADGNACEWCTVGTTDICVNAEQAAFAEQVGGTCADEVVVADPYDPTCILVNMGQGDKETCTATEDGDGNKCQWCTVGTTSICVNADQAAAAEQLSGTCEEATMPESNGSIFSLW